MLDPEGVRRIEAPILVDRKGTVWAPGLIDVTQRYRDRVVLAESPPAGLSAELARALRDSAARLAGARSKAGGFTVSFLANPESGEHRFVATEPGLPEALATVESCTETDLAALEIHLSRGGTLDGEPPESRGHAMQVRLSTLDPEEGFAPSPGIVETLRLPSGPGLRADAGVEEGSPPANGGEVARITAHGRTRAEALARLQRGLAKTEILVRDGATDKAFLAEVLDRPELTDPDAAPSWLDRLVASGRHLPRRGSEAALLGAAISAYESELAIARARFYASAARGRPEPPGELGRPVEISYRGQGYSFRVSKLGRGLFRVEIDGVSLEVLAGPPGRAGRRISLGDRGWRISIADQGTRQTVEVDGIPHRVELKEGGVVRSPARGDARVRFEGLRPTDEGVASPRAESLEEARRLLLGYDADPALVQRLVSGELGHGGTGDLRLEEEILRTFADVGSLFRRQTANGGVDERRSAEVYLFTYLRDLDGRGEGLPAAFLDKLRRALAHYGVAGLDRSAELEESLFRLAVSHQRQERQAPPVLAVLESWLERGGLPEGPELRELLDRVIVETQGREPAVHDLAREVRYRVFDRPLLLATRERLYAAARSDLTRLAEGPAPEERAELIHALVECPQPLHHVLSHTLETAPPGRRATLLEVMVRRYYRIRDLGEVKARTVDGLTFGLTDYDYRGSHVHLIATQVKAGKLPAALETVGRLASAAPADSEIVADVYIWQPERSADDAARDMAALLESAAPPAGLRRVAFVFSGPERSQSVTFRRDEEGVFREERVFRGIHPMLSMRMELWRLQNFELERLSSPDGVYLFRGIARENPRDERLFAVAEVRDLTPVRDESGRVVELPQLERMLMEALAGIRRFQSRRAAGQRLYWNRVQLNVWPPVDLRPDELSGLVRRLEPVTEGLGLEKVAVRCRIPDRDTGELRDWVLEISNFEEAGTVLRVRKPSETPLKPLREYAQKVVELRRRGLPYPYEVIRRLAPSGRDAQPDDLPPGEFVEHDLDAAGRLAPVSRPYGGNQANVVVGLVRNFTSRYPEGMTRVILLGDPSREMGALAEPECRRIVAALELADSLGAPLEWFALAGGTGQVPDAEDMDWTGLVLRRIVELTRKGLEINVVTPAINAGAQAYWNAAATLLMQARGVLILTPERGRTPGGGERILGVNSQAQYFARDLGEACQLLLRHYEHTYTAPGERFPRPAPTRDPREREIRGFPFELRRLLAAVADQDHLPLESWYGMRDGEDAVVLEAHLGGAPVCLLGVESRLASRKVARAINAASGNRPLVVLAGLSGDGGSPGSMRQGQLELGAEIGRAVVDFRGPIVFCMISHGHRGELVVFSSALHDNMEVSALEGTLDSVTGVAPERLRPYLIEAVERGMEKEMAGLPIPSLRLAETT